MSLKITGLLSQKKTNKTGLLSYKILTVFEKINLMKKKQHLENLVQNLFFRCQQSQESRLFFKKI